MNNDEEEFDYLLKMALVGDSGVGKSNLLLRFIKNEFNIETKATIGVEFGSKKIEHEGKILKAQIWDTAGQEKYRAITSSYYRGAVGAIIVYDISKRESFESLDRWISEIQANAEPDVTIVIVGNKSDLNYLREVTQEEAVSYAKLKNMPFFETSALACTNVETVFRELMVRAARIMDVNLSNGKAGLEPSRKNIMRLNSTGKKKSCC